MGTKDYQGPDHFRLGFGVALIFVSYVLLQVSATSESTECHCTSTNCSTATTRTNDTTFVLEKTITPPIFCVDNSTGISTEKCCTNRTSSSYNHFENCETVQNYSIIPVHELCAVNHTSQQCEDKLTNQSKTCEKLFLIENITCVSKCPCGYVVDANFTKSCILISNLPTTTAPPTTSGNMTTTNSSTTEQQCYEYNEKCQKYCGSDLFHFYEPDGTTRICTKKWTWQYILIVTVPSSVIALALITIGAICCRRRGCCCQCFCYCSLCDTDAKHDNKPPSAADLEGKHDDEKDEKHKGKFTSLKDRKHNRTIPNDYHRDRGDDKELVQPSADYDSHQFELRRMAQSAVNDAADFQQEDYENTEASYPPQEDYENLPGTKEDQPIYENTEVKPGVEKERSQEDYVDMNNVTTTAPPTKHAQAQPGEPQEDYETPQSNPPISASSQQHTNTLPSQPQAQSDLLRQLTMINKEWKKKKSSALAPPSVHQLRPPSQEEYEYTDNEPRGVIRQPPTQQPVSPQDDEQQPYADQLLPRGMSQQYDAPEQAHLNANDEEDSIYQNVPLKK